MLENFETTNKYPSYIRIDRNINEKYIKRLQQEKISPFYKNDLTEIYFMSGVIGYIHGSHEETRDSQDLRLYSQLSDEHKIIIRSIATKLHSHKFEIILDGKEICRIFEEYANSGARLLHDLVFDRDPDRFNNYVWEELKKAAEQARAEE